MTEQATADLTGRSIMGTPLKDYFTRIKTDQTDKSGLKPF
jgi:hypothetical protein